MKKFIGFVNGKEFTNETEFQKAANEALLNGETLSISSYYKYENDTDEKKLEDIKIAETDIEPNDDFKVSDYINNNINKISPENKIRLKTYAKDKLNLCKLSYNKLNEEKLDKIKSIKNLKEEISNIDERLEHYTKRHNYFKEIENLLNKQEQECKCGCDGETCDTKKVDVDSKNNKDTSLEDLIEIISGFSDYLNKFGFWDK